MSYTAAVSELEPQSSYRRGVGLLSKSRLANSIRAVVSVPYVLGCSATLLLPGLLMLPLFLIRKRSAKNRSNEEGGSLTAIKTLNARAVVAAVGFGPDHLATKLMARMSLTGPGLLGWLYTQAFHYSLVWGFKLTRRLWVEQVMRPLLGDTIKFVDFTYLQLRTCWLDDVVMRFVSDLQGQRGQLVILGAGYDTRCLRLDLPSSISRFEVDAAGTQAQKRTQIAKAGLNDIGVHYVSCDFTTQDWLAQLTQAGFDPTVPACFVWEGVCMYLPREVVAGTLTKVRSLAPGSVIGFDCMEEAWVMSKAMQKMSQRAGEGLYFGLKAGTESAFVESVGLRCLDNLRRDILVQRYMPKGLSACIDFGAFILAGV
jgi:methyltransferase (TIGR00027 family)